MQKIKTLFISDIYLGNKNSQPDKLLEVFKQYEFDNLFIIGDFIRYDRFKKKILLESKSFNRYSQNS
jgi:UDP-2,3-diacylglucosamine pyrophosphatase LpxH